MNAKEFININYHLNTREYKGELCSDKTFEPVTYDEVAEAYYKSEAEYLDLFYVRQQRELLFAFASYVNKNELSESNDKITDFSIKAFFKANSLLMEG